MNSLDTMNSIKKNLGILMIQRIWTVNIDWIDLTTPTILCSAYI